MSALSSNPAPRWLVVVSVLLGTLAVSLNNTALNPAIPEFMAGFGIDAVAASWVISPVLGGIFAALFLVIIRVTITTLLDKITSARILVPIFRPLGTAHWSASPQEQQ